ncbi:glycosyltransferase family 2 protein [Cellulophaga sp. BC115SP]|uniref:glycosyltransferase family 2 protein n=1 Tax=Cellulophaga sp. BC115SP TaxID=2683263 RepID=UPI001412BEE4|nr:glycosyltransferase family 2 protein [Cellulophaga sp. BC115SP]NBB31847.1 glycosyltransferase [Cellulophaga sp. BC115SP]
MKKIAVLITVHNRKDKTISCLNNLFSQVLIDRFQLDVFLVDDGSTDGTSQSISTLFPCVNIIKGDGSLFWNRGMALAWHTSAVNNYDFYIWLNDDTLLYNDAISVLLEASNKKENKAIIVGTTLSCTNETITYGGRDNSKKIIKPDGELKECIFFNGNFVLVPHYVFRILGTNDSFFQHSLGDFDYGLRAQKKGVRIYVAPSVSGTCDTHDALPIWCNPQKSFTTRWKHFRTPLGHNPEEYFIFEKRHFGITSAIFHYITNHLRVLFPRIWT